MTIKDAHTKAHDVDAARDDRYCLAACALVARSLGIAGPDLIRPAYDWNRREGTRIQYDGAAVYEQIALYITGPAASSLRYRRDESGTFGEFEDYQLFNMLVGDTSGEHAQLLASVVYSGENRQWALLVRVWKEVFAFLTQYWNVLESLAVAIETGLHPTDVIPRLKWRVRRVE